MRITIFEELVHSVSYDGGIELLFEPYKTKALHYLKKMDLEKFPLYQYETLAKGLFDDEINFTDYGQARDYFAEKLLQDTYI